MIRINDAEMAWRTFRTLERLQAVLYLQRFVGHPGWDLRIFVLAGQVLTAMRRHNGSDWRTNVAQGGRGEASVVSDEERKLAIRAAAALGASMAGVDLLPGPSGEWYVIEVNAVPGWRALAPVTGVDIATAVIRFLTEADDLVVDPFAGSNVTGWKAEELGRRWLATEVNAGYVAGSRLRFDGQAAPVAREVAQGRLS